MTKCDHNLTPTLSVLNDRVPSCVEGRVDAGQRQPAIEMKIALFTDAWRPQINGVVRTLQQTRARLEELGHETVFVTPSDFATCPCPAYPSVRLALFPGKGVEGILRAAKPDTVHIATEGPIGHAARSVCCRLGIPFTSSFHTLFPEYIRARVPLPVGWSYSYLRRDLFT